MSSVEFRQAWVPLLGVQNRLVYLNLGLSTSPWASYGQHEANLGHLGPIWGPFWSHCWTILASRVACLFVLRFSPPQAFILASAVLLLCLASVSLYKGAHAKNTVKYSVFAIFHVAPQTSSRTSKSAPGRSQNHPQERPGAARDSPKSSPRGFKTAPRAAKSAPRAPRAAQTRLPNGPGGEVGPN